jgi:hypothetical protein
MHPATPPPALMLRTGQGVVAMLLHCSYLAAAWEVEANALQQGRRMHWQAGHSRAAALGASSCPGPVTPTQHPRLAPAAWKLPRSPASLLTGWSGEQAAL